MFTSLVFMYLKNCRITSLRYITKNPAAIKLGQNDKLSILYCMWGAYQQGSKTNTRFHTHKCLEDIAEPWGRGRL